MIIRNIKRNNQYYVCVRDTAKAAGLSKPNHWYNQFKCNNTNVEIKNNTYYVKVDDIMSCLNNMNDQDAARKVRKRINQIVSPQKSNANIPFYTYGNIPVVKATEVADAFNVTYDYVLETIEACGTTLDRSFFNNNFIPWSDKEYLLTKNAFLLVVSGLREANIELQTICKYMQLFQKHIELNVERMLK